MHAIEGQWDMSITVGVTCTFTPNGPRKRNSKEKRKGRPTTNTRKLTHRTRHWTPLMLRLRKYIDGGVGRQSMIASYVGVHDAQIHRYVCPQCEHDQEPPYSIAKAIETYLTNL